MEGTEKRVPPWHRSQCNRRLSSTSDYTDYLEVISFYKSPSSVLPILLPITGSQLQTFLDVPLETREMVLKWLLFIPVHSRMIDVVYEAHNEDKGNLFVQKLPSYCLLRESFMRKTSYSLIKSYNFICSIGNCTDLSLEV